MTMQDLNFTWMTDFTMRGRLAYLSHQETLTLFQRAMLRAKVPLVFSSGFNPRPHLSIPLPRSVGMQSEAERLCAAVRFAEPPNAESVCQSVRRQLPAGCDLFNASVVAGRVTVYPVGSLLRFTLNETVDSAAIEHIRSSIAAHRSGSPILVQRYMAKKECIKPLNIAPFLEYAELEGPTLNVRCRVSGEGTVRADELMQWFNLRPEHMAEPVRRMEIYWNTTAA